MSSRSLPASGHAAAENELLAQLGLPPTAATEDVDHLHEAVSEYLAAAPASIGGWAHAQATALDAAYLQLTDPVGFGGALPTAPQPGDEGVMVEATDEELEVLYTSVTPSAHRDSLSSAKLRAGKARPPTGEVVVKPTTRPGGGPWKRIVLGAVGVVAAAGILFVGYSFGGGGAAAVTPSPNAVQASPSAPTVDLARVAGLMEQLQVNRNDTATLMALGNEYYAAAQLDAAGQWFDKVLAIDPKNVDALLARGAVSFSLADLTAAEATWKQVIAIDPRNVEAHYALGFLYLNQATPDRAGVEREWNEVIALDPTSRLAQTVKSHLDSLAAASMVPGASGTASSTLSGSPAASAAP